jgi:hypothetical protein
MENKITDRKQQTGVSEKRVLFSSIQEKPRKKKIEISPTRTSANFNPQDPQTSVSSRNQLRLSYEPKTKLLNSEQRQTNKRKIDILAKAIDPELRDSWAKGYENTISLKEILSRNMKATTFKSTLSAYGMKPLNPLISDNLSKPLRQQIRQQKDMLIDRYETVWDQFGAIRRSPYQSLSLGCLILNEASSAERLKKPFS